MEEEVVLRGGGTILGELPPCGLRRRVLVDQLLGNTQDTSDTLQSARHGRHTCTDTRTHLPLSPSHTHGGQGAPGGSHLSALRPLHGEGQETRVKKRPAVKRDAEVHCVSGTVKAPCGTVGGRGGRGMGQHRQLCDEILSVWRGGRDCLPVYPRVCPLDCRAVAQERVR